VRDPHRYGLRVTELTTNPFEHLDDVGAAVREPGFYRGREPRERVGDREHTRHTSRKLIMGKAIGQSRLLAWRAGDSYEALP
jgi:hypothetical protein